MEKIPEEGRIGYVHIENVYLENELNNEELHPQIIREGVELCSIIS